MEYRPYFMAKEWIAAGHKVQIVAASYSHVRSSQPQLEQLWAREQIDGVPYYWYKTPAYSGNGVGRVKNILRFIWSLWRDAGRWAATFKPDVVVASSTYPMDIWPAQRIAKKAGASLVYEVHDLWPLSPMSLGKLSKWHPFIMWVQWAEDTAYRVSHHVVSMLPQTLSYMKSRGLRPEKWSYVPNGVDLGQWDMVEPLPAALASGLDKLRWLNRPLLAYTGSHGVANALDPLLDAAALLAGEVEILLLGHGPEKERLQQRVQAEGLKNIHFWESIPKKYIPAFLQAVDIAYIGWLPEPLYRFGISPNKLMDYMMAGKPIVHSVLAGNDLVQEAQCGISVPPCDAQAIAEAIRTLSRMSAQERQTLGNNGKSYARSRLSYQVLAQSFISNLKVKP